MSRRYGRNQRRRAREAIASLTDAREEALKDADSWRAVADRQRGRAGLLEAQINTARRVLGDTVALPPVEWLMLDAEARSVAASGLQVTAPANPMTLDFVSSEWEARSTVETLTLNVLEGGIDFSRTDALYRQPHAYLCSRETGELRYAIAPSVLAQLDERTVIERIAHMLAQNMAKDLKRFKR